MKQHLLTFLALVAGVLTAQGADSRPNILFIVGDDMGYGDVGFHQCQDIPTPNLDALAKAGVRFTSGYVTGPYCSPTRAGLLTGRYQTRFGHEFNPGGSGDKGLPLTEQTIADRLKAAGYVTGLVGKWHLGSQPAMHPQKRGFDEFFGFLGGAHSYLAASGVYLGTNELKNLPYMTDAFGDEASAFVEKHQSRPWFLYLAFNAVHTPMHATEDRLKRFAGITDEKRRTYAAMMSAMDDAIGKVRKSLAVTGQEQRTWICFISDNGGPTMRGVTVNGADNKPLRGSKRTTLEGGVRVPFLVVWPGKIKPGVYEKPVIQLDLHATALAVAGVALKFGWKLEGVDLHPFITGKNPAAPHDALYWRFGDQMAIRKGDYKLVRYDLTADGEGGGGAAASEFKLYDLAKDIGESKDLAATQPEKVKELQAQWNEWNKSNVSPLWGGKGGKDDASPAAPARKKKKKQE